MNKLSILILIVLTGISNLFAAEEKIKADDKTNNKDIAEFFILRFEGKNEEDNKKWEAILKNDIFFPDIGMHFSPITITAPFKNGEYWLSSIIGKDYYINNLKINNDIFIPTKMNDENIETIKIQKMLTKPLIQHGGIQFIQEEVEFKVKPTKRYIIRLGKCKPEENNATFIKKSDNICVEEEKILNKKEIKAELEKSTGLLPELSNIVADYLGAV